MNLFKTKFNISLVALMVYTLLESTCKIFFLSFFLFGDLKVTQNYKHKTDVIHPRYLKQKTCTMGLTMP